MTQYMTKTITINRKLFKFLCWFFVILGISAGIYGCHCVKKINDEQTNIYVTRFLQNGKTLNGKLQLYYRVNPVMYNTVENTDFIIPDGIYEVQNTYSVKFGKTLPLICDVPGRAGIRIHEGYYHNNSKGCILVSPGSLKDIMKFIYKNDVNDKKTYIHIKTIII